MPDPARSGSRRPAGSATALGVVLALAVAAVTLAACAPEAPEAADGDGAPDAVAAEELREILIRGFERHRQMDVDFVRAVPDTALRWAPYPEVRDYAQQIRHISLDNARLTARAALGEEPPVFGDSAVYLNDKEELERVVEEAYDYVLASLREMPAEALLEETELFGEERARWRVFLLALHHADWTRGQLVPYLRLNDVEPPVWRSY